MCYHRAVKMLGNLRDWQLFLLVHGIFVVIGLAPFLLGFGLFSGIGIGHSYAFFEQYTFENLWSGAVLMNRFSMNGFPTFIPIGFAFNPFVYLFTAIFPPFTDLHWYNFATMTAGGVLCSLFLRRSGISKAGALMGGGAYMTGCWWLMVTGDYSPFLPMMPLVAWVLLICREKPWKAMLWGSLLSGYIWLGVNSQVSMMIFTAFGAGAVALAAQEYRHGWKAVLRPLWVMFGSVFIGTILGIPKVLPAFIYGNLSWRAGGIELGTATASGLQPLTPVTYVFPYASFPFLNFGGELLQVYIGAFAFVLLLTGIFLALRQNASPALRWWVFGYALILILSFAHSPLANVLHSFPPFSYFRGAGRWTMIASFLAAPIVGYGFDAVMAGQAEGIRCRLARFFQWLAAGIAIICVVGQAALLFFTDALIALFQQYFAYFHATLHLSSPLSYYQTFVERRIQELAADPLFLEPRALLPFLAVLTVAIVLHHRVWPRFKQHAMSFVLLNLFVTSLTLVPYDNFFDRSALARPNEVAAYLERHPGTVLSLFANESGDITHPGYSLTRGDEVEWIFTHLIPNSNLFYKNIHTLDYFDNISSRRPTVLATFVGAEWLSAPNEFRLNASGTVEEKIQKLVQRKDLLDLQGVRYIVSPFALPAPFRKVFETKILGERASVMIYENPDVRPFVYFADRLQLEEEGENIALKYVLVGKWPGRRSFLECEPDCAIREVDGIGSVSVTGNVPTRVVLKTQTQRPQWLIVTLNRLPGWEVFIDQKPVASVYANAAHFGIPVPAGEHTVELRFSLFAMLRDGLSYLK